MGEESRLNKLLRIITVGSAIFLLVMLVGSNIIRFIYQLNDANTALGDIDDATRAALVLERAEDAVGSVELVLSFLEGASIIIGLGFGALTIYGLRNTQETREQLKAEVERVEDIRKQLDSQLAELQGYRPYLENLATLRNELQQSQISMRRTIDNVATVLQADQEFRLKNYDSAYDFANKVLADDPDNRQALYIAGWLEVQHVRDRLEEGIRHLEHLVHLDSSWPVAKAAYGIGLRRKARGTSESAEREKLFLHAEGVLKEALSQSPRLMDFEGESFWGPVGGILREIGQYDGAIAAYEKALEVTPSSSYPWGNLATLYLRRAKETGSRQAQEKALNAFENTVRTAHGELVTQPDNYYLLMDIAQAATILGQRDAVHFKEAESSLQAALSAEVSLNAMETSRRGWQDMLDHCPDEWESVRKALQKALEIIDGAIARV